MCLSHILYHKILSMVTVAWQGQSQATVEVDHWTKVD